MAIGQDLTSAHSDSSQRGFQISHKHGEKERERERERWRATSRIYDDADIDYGADADDRADL